MKRRFESLFASGALLLLLSFTLLYGCRAFDPEPVIVNRAPDTFLTGAPAETTGAGFRRHIFWYGTDNDGEVVQYIYAITDSTVRDVDDPEIDEEDARFNPALDITTLEQNAERFVGWTTNNDSLFEFTIDRGSESSKEITFHIVAVDDRGEIDPTPARLRFLNNTLGNPTIQFSVFVDVEADGSGGDLRWIGNSDGPDASSPEQTERPFIGYRKPFRIEWEGSSPNFDPSAPGGGIIGYRVKTAQGPANYTPSRDPETGEKLWDPTITQATYRNELPATDPATGENCNGESGSGCDTEVFRFPSGPFDLSVEVLDRTLVESTPSGGVLNFEINYPPETEILVDGSSPSWVVYDDSGNALAVGTIEPPIELPDGSVQLDTIPTGAYVTFRSTGYDRFENSVPVGQGDLLCCDTPLESATDTIPEVRFQSRLATTSRREAGDDGIFFQNSFSLEREDGDVTFLSGPLDFTYTSRTLDEHRRPDPTPDQFDFVGGFRPRIREDLMVPSTALGDSVILRSTIFTTARWPENEISYEVGSAETRRFTASPTDECGIRELDLSSPDGIAVTGLNYRIRFRFVGEGDPRDPLAQAKGWSFRLFGDGDPANDILTGAESRDLSVFVDSPQPDLWDWSEDDALELWIPDRIWFEPGLYSEDNASCAICANIGCLLRRVTGNMTLEVVARSTEEVESYSLFNETAIDSIASPENSASIRVGDKGRRSEVYHVDFGLFLGVDPTLTGQITTYWPDFEPRD